MHKVNYKNIKITYYYLILFITCITTTQNRLKNPQKAQKSGIFYLFAAKNPPKTTKKTGKIDGKHTGHNI